MNDETGQTKSATAIRDGCGRVNSDFANEAKSILPREVYNDVHRTNSDGCDGRSAGSILPGDVPLTGETGSGKISKTFRNRDLLDYATEQIERAPINIDVDSRPRRFCRGIRKPASTTIEQQHLLGIECGKTSGQGVGFTSGGCAGAMMSRAGYSPGAGQNYSETNLEYPSHVIRAAVALWSSAQGVDLPDIEDLDELCEHIVQYLEHNGYPMTDLQNGDVELATDGKNGMAEIKAQQIIALNGLRKDQDQLIRAQRRTIAALEQKLTAALYENVRP